MTGELDGGCGRLRPIARMPAATRMNPRARGSTGSPRAAFLHPFALSLSKGERAWLRVLPLAAALLLATAAHASPADVSLEARVDRAEVSLDEVVTLEIRLESPEAPSKLDLPDTPEFEVISHQQSQQQDFTLGGGGGVLLRRAYVVTVQLRPTRAGALTIPSVRAVVRGREYVTQPIVVKVSGAGSTKQGPARPDAGPPTGGRAYHGWEKDLTLVAELDRKEAYLGEQVVVTFWLLSPLELLQCDSTAPRYDGFWKEELETPRTIRHEVRDVNGIPTRAYLIQRVALFPTRTGELTVDPMALPRIQLRLGQPSLLGGLGQVATAARKSRPVTLRVKPLPPDAPPGHELANVGDLSLEASVSPARVAVGEPFTIRVSVTGDGNVRALSPPRVPALPGLRTFQPTTRDLVAQSDRRLVGTRTVETVLVPERSGELVLPPVEWPFFNPRTGKYQVARTPQLEVTVVPAGGPSGAPAAPGSNALAAGLRPIRADGALSRRGPPPWRRAWFLALLLVPPLALLGAATADRLRSRGGGARALRSAGRSVRRRIGAARRRLSRGDGAAAVVEVERALLGYASDRLGRPAAGLTRDELAAELQRAGAHPPAVRALLRALDLVDAARYGAGDAHGEEVLSAAELALDALEEADWRSAEEVA